MVLCKCGKKATSGLLSVNPLCDECTRKRLQELNKELSGWMRK